MAVANKEHSEVETTFRHDVIKEVLKSKFVNPKNKISDEAVELVSEIAKMLVIETAARSAKQAKAENRSAVTLEHVETILPQLMLDFP
nr:centromere protein X-like [Leptinotarsa decemlineata]